MRFRRHSIPSGQPFDGSELGRGGGMSYVNLPQADAGGLRDGESGRLENTNG